MNLFGGTSYAGTHPCWQWQPTLSSHNPNPPLTLLDFVPGGPGFRSFASIWFGPESGGGDGGGGGPLAGGRKLISQALAATLQAELT